MVKVSVKVFSNSSRPQNSWVLVSETFNPELLNKKQIDYTLQN